MTRHIVLIGFIALTFSSIYVAQSSSAVNIPSNITGRYICVGQGGDEKVYTTALTIDSEQNYFRVRWEHSSEQVQFGVGMLQGSTLMIAFFSPDYFTKKIVWPPQIGLVVYQIDAGGTHLNGQWITALSTIIFPERCDKVVGGEETGTNDGPIGKIMGL